MRTQVPLVDDRCAPDATFPFGVERGKGIHNCRDGLTERSVLETYCNAHAENEAFDIFVGGHYLSHVTSKPLFFAPTSLLTD